MPGLKISMPEPVHRMRYRVLYGDTDAAGVVYYGNYMRYFEAGRTEYMRERGFTYRSMEENGTVLPVIECGARYKASAVYDDLLLIETSLAELKEVSCRFNYRVLRCDEVDGQSATTLLAKGYTTHASVDRDGKLIKLPGDILHALREIIASAEQSFPRP